MNILDEIKIEKIEKSDEEEIERLIREVFLGNRSTIDLLDAHATMVMYVFLNNHFCRWTKHSIKAVYKNKIIGVELLSDCPILLVPNKKNKNLFKKIEDKRGLRSAFLGVLPKYQAKGIGGKMLEYVDNNYKDFNYIWGTHQISVSNVGFFLKRRKVISKKDGVIYSYKLLPK